MAQVKVQFACRVKYNGKFYPAYTPILADEVDVAKMKKQGAFVLQEEPEEQIVPPKPTRKPTKRNGRLND